MSEVLAVSGATNHQGILSINVVLKDGELFEQYTICALTCDLES